MELIDHCYYINLDSRTDRNNHMINFVLPFFDIDETKYTRYSAIDTSNESTLQLRSVGCAQSHLNVHKDAYDKGYNYILVLEDDFIPTVSKEDFFNYWNYFINNFSDFNLCQLSYRDMIEVKPVDNSNIVFHSNNVQTASAYVIKTSFASKIKPTIESSIEALRRHENPNLHAFDQSWKKFQSLENKWYQLKKCGVQSMGYSDLEKRYTNYGC